MWQSPATAVPCWWVLWISWYFPLSLLFSLCKNTNKRIKNQRKTRFSLFFQAEVPSLINNTPKVIMNTPRVFSISPKILDRSKIPQTLPNLCSMLAHGLLMGLSWVSLCEPSIQGHEFGMIVARFTPLGWIFFLFFFHYSKFFHKFAPAFSKECKTYCSIVTHSPP